MCPLTADLVNWDSLPMPMPAANLKALYLLKQNLRTLLWKRKEDQVTLAKHVGHTKAWINKFLSPNPPPPGEKEPAISLRDLDRIADFFGLAPYQLFQPGISALTERRTSADRRSGQDRRIGHTARLLTELRVELNKVPHFATPTPGGTYDLSTVPPAVIVLEAARLVAEHPQLKLSGKQTSGARRRVAGAPRRHRSVRRPDPGAPKP
jgi:hypothetical protein